MADLIAISSAENASARAKRQIILIVLAVVAVVVVGIPLVERLAADRQLLKPYDFVEYWSAGRQVLDGRNPYDPDELFALQRSMYDVRKTVMMWNPPWTLPLTLPFGAIHWRLAQLLWFVMQLTAVLMSVDLLWRIYGGAARYRWVSWLVALTFAPTLFLLLIGQVSGLPLLGIAGFLYFIRKDRPTLAGCCAVLTAIKPHLLPLFALALLLESTHRRSARRAIATGAGILLALGLLPLLWNSHVWSQYFEAMRRPPSETLETMRQFEHPTIGYELRLLMPGQPFTAQFIPGLLALLALVVYWLARRRSWQWEREMPLLVLVSVVSAVYGAWAFDLVILLVPIVQTTVRLTQSGTWKLIGVVGTTYPVGNLLLLLTLSNKGSQSNPWISLVVLAGWVGLNWRDFRSLRVAPDRAGTLRRLCFASVESGKNPPVGLD
jgi:hypothetical protein